MQHNSFLVALYMNPQLIDSFLLFVRSFASHLRQHSLKSWTTFFFSLFLHFTYTLFCFAADFERWAATGFTWNTPNRKTVTTLTNDILYWSYNNIAMHCPLRILNSFRLASTQRKEWERKEIYLWKKER